MLGVFLDCSQPSFGESLFLNLWFSWTDSQQVLGVLLSLHLFGYKCIPWHPAFADRPYTALVCKLVMRQRMTLNFWPFPFLLLILQTCLLPFKELVWCWGHNTGPPACQSRTPSTPGIFKLELGIQLRFLSWYNKHSTTWGTSPVPNSYFSSFLFFKIYQSWETITINEY